ncbi:MAG: hypothetical protein ACYC7L_10720, partial [Nitrospirota bacterium]
RYLPSLFSAALRSFQDMDAAVSTGPDAGIVFGAQEDAISAIIRMQNGMTTNRLLIMFGIPRFR